MNADESNKKRITGVFGLLTKGGLFRILLFLFLIIALVPLIINHYIDSRHFSIYFLFFLLFFIILSAFVAAKWIASPVEMLLNDARRASSGEFDQSININAKNEIGALASLFNDMILKLKNAAEEKKYQVWVTEGCSALIDLMRGEQDIPVLCSNIISFASEYLNAQVGLMYMNEDGLFRLSGSYAYTWNRNNHSVEFRVGEGLVGQAALKKRIIILNDVPEDHISISSGFGEMAPRSIIVLPVLSVDGSVAAVIELGTIHEFSDRTKDFLNHISKSIAIALNNAQSRKNVNMLLEKTSSQAAELQKKQEELSGVNEELEAQSKAHKENQEKLKQQQEELKKTNEELEEKTRGLEKQKEEMRLQNQAIEEARRLLEERAKEIEISSQYKSQFLANMSHELRTPLNSIILLSQLLSDNREQNLTEKQVEYAKSVQSSGYDLLKLINEILDLSKVESGKVELNIEAVPLTDITNAIERNFKPLVEEKNISFTVSIDGNLPQVMHSDKQRIEQVLKNLLANAFKFTSRGG
ncbi:MAG: GAF domain-containing protein, partial [Deltaproteobacteria bacterium]|nr:GAF domain-containing protein [Deltaproteobacteria bacterium]